MERIGEILLRAQIAYDLKAENMRIVRKETDPVRLLAELHGLSLPGSLYGAILEMLSGC